MAFKFATCDKNMAMRFLAKLYPSYEVTEEKVSKLIDLVQKDILRIEDPDFHSPAQVVTGKEYSEEYDEEINEAIEQLKEAFHSN